MHLKYFNIFCSKLKCLSGRVQSRQLPRGGGHQQQHGLHLEED